MIIEIEVTDKDLYAEYMDIRTIMNRQRMAPSPDTDEVAG